MKKFLRQYHKIFPKKFSSYWKKNRSILNIDDDLKEITNSFIQSKSYNFVSNYWHHLSIEHYKSLGRYGQKKGIAVIAQNYFVFTDLYDEKLNKVKTLPYKNNYGYFFTSGPNTWHGMEKKEIKLRY